MISIKLVAVILVAFSTVSCSSNNRKNADTLSTNKKVSFPNQQSKSDDTIKIENSTERSKSKPDSATELTFSKSVKSFIVKGRLNNPGDTAIYFLIVTDPARLTARIEINKKPVNIRINQIVMPNGQSDGPFGQQIEYPLPQKGIYKIKIGHNLMAENAFIGDFLLYLTVQ